MKTGVSGFKKAKQTGSPVPTGHLRDTGSPISMGIDMPGTHTQLAMRGTQSRE